MPILAAFGPGSDRSLPATGGGATTLGTQPVVAADPSVQANPWT